MNPVLALMSSLRGNLLVDDELYGSPERTASLARMISDMHSVRRESHMGCQDLSLARHTS